MSRVLLGVGLFLIGFACLVIWRWGYGPRGDSEFGAPGGWFFKTVFPPLIILFLGIALVVASQISLGSDGDASKPSPPKDTRAQMPPATTTAQPIPTPNTSPSPGPSPPPSPVPTLKRNGPWEDRQEDVHLVVERIRRGRGVGGRLAINMRIENDSVHELDPDEDPFIAVDSFGDSHGADWDNSDWQEPSSADFDRIQPGRTVRGFILLADNVPNSATALSVRYTVPLGYGEPTLTLTATIPLRRGASPSAH